MSYSPYGGETVTYGDTSAQWQQNPYGFKVGIRASSTDNGLTKFGYRWQSATTGTWIERDTLDAPLNPSNANRYAYAGTDPVNKSDPSGRISLSGGLGLASFVVGAAGLAASATGVGIAAAPFLGLASSALNVGSLIAGGASGGAVASAAITGAFTFGIGGGLGANLAGDLSSGSRFAQTLVGGVSASSEVGIGAFGS